MLHVFPEAYQWKWSSFKLHFLRFSTRSEKGSILPPVPPGLIVAVLWVAGSSWSRLYWDRRLAESQLMKSLGRFVAVESSLCVQCLLVAVCHVWNTNATLKICFQCFCKVSRFFWLFVVQYFFLPKFQNSHGKEGILKTL